MRIAGIGSLIVVVSATAVLLACYGCGGGAPPGDGGNGATGATLSGTVVDAEHIDQPLVGAAVSWTSTVAAAGARQTTTTDAEGAFTLTRVDPGPGRLVVVPAGSEFGSLSVDMDLSEEGADIRVPLVSNATAARITGISVSPQMASVPFGGQRQFNLVPEATGDGAVMIHPLWLVNSGIGSIDAEGLFTAGMTEGRGAVLATAAGMTAAATVTVGTNVVEPSDLTLVLHADPSPAPPGATVAITATVTGATGTPTYRWSTAHPPLEGSGATVTWTAPEQEGLYGVSCYVYDSTGATVSSNLVMTVGRLGQIAFTSYREENTGTYIMREDGSDLIRFTPAETYEYNPTWAPDGSKLVCLSGRSDPLELWVINADGSDAHPVTSGQITYTALGESLTWSSDSARIAFTGDAGASANHDDEIFVVNADGTGLTRVTDHPGYEWEPSWQPGGERIAYCYMNPDVPGDEFDIWAVNADGTDMTNLTNTPDVGERFPHWSPDGTRIVFSRMGDDLRQQVWVMDADGSNQTNLSGNDYNEAPWAYSPDGTKILFWSDRDSTDTRLYVMNSDGSGVVRLADFRTCGRPSWSPDSRRVAFSAWPQNPEPGIWVARADGLGATRITTSGDDHEWVDWRPE